MYTNESTIALGVIGAILVLYLLILGIGIASYVMTSLSLYTLADRRQIKNPWLAWIPIANYWIVGSLADDYDEKNGIKRKWRVALLVLCIVYFVVFIVMYIALMIRVVLMTIQSGYGEPELTGLIGTLVIAYILLIVMTTFALVLSICYYICLYKIFESTVPEKALTYLLLTFFVPLAGPICLMQCRKKGYSKQNVYPNAVVQPVDTADVSSSVEEKGTEENFSEE